ncbi:MAG: TetR/AcrR family transcriptional regulator [Novosphingobium sp.]|nr:TetR/AcrR family transcriptional regulator [Novosphingobium sp.]
MNEIEHRLRAALLPSQDPEPAPRWQQRKSAQTRERVLEAAIDCLVADGYSGLTTNAVAVRAGMSRGTMHHHFATRGDLVEALTEYTFYQRMRGFLVDYSAAMHAGGEARLVEIAADAHWRNVQSREYAAYLELAIAARTDTELEPHFTPAAQRYDAVWFDEMKASFPQWEEHWQSMKVANDFTLAAHMGLLLHRPVFGEGGRLEAVRQLITSVIVSLYASHN